MPDQRPKGGNAAEDRRLLAALSHPLRVRILDHLQAHERASPAELSAAFGIPLGNVSYHVRRLHALGLLALVKRTQRRGAIEHHYSAVTDLDAERVVAQLAGRFYARPDPATLSTRVVLDAPAVAEVRRHLEDLFARMRALEAATAARGTPGGSPVHIVCVVEGDQRART